MEDGRGIQGLCVHLVAIIAQPDDDGIQMEYDLHILHLPDFAIQCLDGEQDEVVSIILLKPLRDFVTWGAVASLI